MSEKKSNPALWFGATGILLLVALAVVYWAYSENQARTESMTVNTSSDQGLPEYNVQNWIKGNPQADQKLVVFSDFGCIHCARFHAVINEFFEEYDGDKLAFEMRHYPINNNFHSRAAAVASVAAGKQGKFWEMTDLLYFNTDHWRSENPEAGFMGMAEYLELDLERFRQDLYSEDIMYNVVRGHLAAQQFGIRATPTVFLNGEQIQTPQTLDQMYALIGGRTP
ncbi:MAG: DsbA family protein [Balneolales bacterium]|nr:DsbA family protein [Balneolales bacterium]